MISTGMSDVQISLVFLVMHNGLSSAYWQTHWGSLEKPEGGRNNKLAYGIFRLSIIQVGMRDHLKVKLNTLLAPCWIKTKMESQKMPFLIRLMYPWCFMSLSTCDGCQVHFFVLIYLTANLIPMPLE